MDRFENPKMEVIPVTTEDVVVTSGVDTEGESLVKDPKSSDIHFPVDWFL